MQRLIIIGVNEHYTPPPRAEKNCKQIYSKAKHRKQLSKISNMHASNEVRVFVKQFDNTIRNTNDNANLKIICADIEKLIKYENETELKCFSFSNYSESRACFIRNFYMSVLKSALNNISTDTPKHLSVHALSAFLQFLFLNGNYKDSLLTLAWGINEFRPSYRLNKCVSLLEEFLSSHVLCKIFKQQCSVTSQVEQTYVWDELINAITSLPDKTANKLQSQNSELFYPKCYITLVTKDIITVLDDMVTSVKANKDIHLEFISRLIGKLCITGYADMLMEVMVGSLAPVLKEDFIWCRICERIITGVPDRCLESVLLSMIDKLPWYGLMDKFLGDSILKKQKIQYLLCTKVLLFRHSEKIHILQNVLGYLGTSHTRRHLLIKSFKELLSVWGDNSAIRHTSPEQHLYLTRALFISLGFLTEKDKETHKDELIRLIMPGVQAHIGNSEHKIRKQGMVLAETLASVIDPNGPKLKFEYEKDKGTVALLELMIPPSDPGLEQLQKKFEAIQLEQKAETKMMDTDHKTAKQMETRTDVDSDLDSDDDLVPYDMSNDVKVTQVKEPKYIRDCMEGLISNDEPERTEICLKCAEGLIRKHPDGLEEIATEFTKVLLHLGDKYAIPGYTQQRFKAMVSLTVCVPIQVADYLTAEFYDRNYNLRQRMDILESLKAVEDLIMKNLNDLNDWTLKDADVQNNFQNEHYQMLEANMLAIKRQEQEFLTDFEELRQQFKDILSTAGINQSQFPVTPNKNLAAVDSMTPTFMLTPKGLTDLDIQKYLLINTSNDSTSYRDQLQSDGCSDAEHSPMSTDTELSDEEDETVFFEREVEGCEDDNVYNLDDSLQFSTAFIAGNFVNGNQKKKQSFGSSKGQGSNPLASSTMIEEPTVQNRCKPVCRGVSIPKASSTLLYKPFPERKGKQSFSPVIKIKPISSSVSNKKEKTVTNTITESVFTWSLQHSSTDVPLEESYLRTVKKRSNRPSHSSRQMSKVTVRSHKMASKLNLLPNETINGMSMITRKSTNKNKIFADSLNIENSLYNSSKTIPRSSTRANMQSCRPKASADDKVFKEPVVTSSDEKVCVERKNSVVKKLLKFRESFKKKNDWTLKDADVQNGFQNENYQMLEANMLAIKRQEQEFLTDFEELRQQFKDILSTAGINQSQFPVTPNKNLAAVDQMTPTFMLTPKGLTDLDIQKCLLINTLNDSTSYRDQLQSDGCSDAEHSPMSTDTELSDDEDETVFFEREVEGCEDEDVYNLDDSLQFSTSFIAGNFVNGNQKKKQSFKSSKGQGSNPLASSTMIEEPTVQNRCKPICRGVSIPKASSTLLYTPFPEKKGKQSFSPVIKIKDIQMKPISSSVSNKKKTTVTNTNTESVFTWSLQHSSTDVPLEESYLRTVKKRSNRPSHSSKHMSKVTVRSYKMASRSKLLSDETINGMSMITRKSTNKNKIFADSLNIENSMYNSSKTIPHSSTRANMQSCRPKTSVDDKVFKKPVVTSSDEKVLASAAQELSQPAEQPVINISDKKIVEVEEDTWQSIVQKRIESKTRRFSKGKSKPELRKTMNRFAPVAGHFFYPLMTRFDRKENTFDMLGEDSLVLGRLIYTLGVVMYSAINSPTVKQMATVLLEFLWVLRFHQDQSVRHSVLFCLSMVMLSVPGHVLLSQLQSEIMEAKQWLEDVVQKDPDTESKRLALQCLVLLENTIKQEFTGEEPA
ncbi:TELO2 [Mytilus coruscus]|uniref:Telomere length regulation protein TEL2 homolog n=1 Tax=Mytilus coruscus TaxID=42192 RepID=A0A6J8BPG6_MYTCO|nr:TELO2 [Mytilus coruscus]